MKRWIVLACLVGVGIGLVLGITIRAPRAEDVSTAPNTAVRLVVDGQLVGTGTLSQGEVSKPFVPAQELVEALKGKYTWDPTDKTVAVFTNRYYETKLAGDWKTYSVPYYGVSVMFPAGGTVVASPQFIQVDYRKGSFALNRVDALPSKDFASRVKGFADGVVVSLGAKITGQKEIKVPGALQAIEIQGTAPISGKEAPLRVRYISDEKSVWIVLAWPDPDLDPSGAMITKVLESFSYQ